MILSVPLFLTKSQPPVPTPLTSHTIVCTSSFRLFHPDIFLYPRCLSTSAISYKVPDTENDSKLEQKEHYLSKLMIKILPIRITSGAIAGDPFCLHAAVSYKRNVLIY